METLQPKLRFPEFKGNWNKFQIKDIGNIITGNTPPTANNNFYNGNYLFVSPFDINTGRWVKNTKTTLTKEGFEKGRKIRKGSTMFVCIGSTIGKIAQNNIDCITNQQINSVVPIDNDDNFVYSLLEYHSPKIRLLAAEQAVPLINKTTFSEYELLMPSLEEQTKIANFLSSVDEKLNLLKEKKTLLEDYKKGIMQKIFNQEIRFKDDNGNDFEDWKTSILSDVVNLFHGFQFRTSDFTSKGIAVIKISNVIGNNLDLNNLTFIKKERFEDFKSFEIKNDDILMSLTGNIGRIIEVKDKPFTILQNYRVGKFIPLDENVINKPFLKYLLASDLVFGRFSQLANQSAQANFGKQDMDKINISYPPIAEQTKIANFLSAIDEKIELVSNQIQDTQEYKRGLLQQMFV